MDYGVDHIIEGIATHVDLCEGVAKAFRSEQTRTALERMNEACENVGRAWSGSWLGYLSCVYSPEFTSTSPYGRRVPIETGSIPVGVLLPGFVGTWQERRFEDVVADIHTRAGEPDMGTIIRLSEDGARVVRESKNDFLTSIYVLLEIGRNDRLGEYQMELDSVPERISPAKWIKGIQPSHVDSNDIRAMSDGICTPPHVYVLSELQSYWSVGETARQVAEIGKRLHSYLTKHSKIRKPASEAKMTTATAPKSVGKIFIGHGHSHDWKDLHLFLNKLNLKVEEFNTESPAGLSNKERLLKMLDEAAFAFLVLTPEDERADRTKHARENVVHEVGLFQGKLGWEKAIVMLEDGCTAFSNIDGLGEIRFASGNIRGKAEEIMAVLEREHILPKR